MRFFLLFALFGFASAEQIPVTADVRLPSKFTKSGEEEPPHWRYLLHLPASYQSDESKNWPMIFFMHGRSIRGDDLNKVKRYGPPALLDRQPDFPFIVVSPQLPDHSWPASSLVKLLDEVVDKYRIDKNRIYLTGVSMGGGGSWYFAAAAPDRFAAFAPLCGYGGTSIAGKFKNLPVWAFHGEYDEAVSMEPHQKLVDAVNESGGDAYLTVIAGGNHGNIIFPVYKNGNIYKWFLAHEKGKDPGELSIRRETEIIIPPSRIVTGLPKKEEEKK